MGYILVGLSHVCVVMWLTMWLTMDVAWWCVVLRGVVRGGALFYVVMGVVLCSALRGDGRGGVLCSTWWLAVVCVVMGVVFEGCKSIRQNLH